MVGKNCAVYGCNNTQGIRHESGKVHFYAFPKQPWLQERRQKWANFCMSKRIDGTKWEPSAHSKICSEHFIGGCKSEHPNNPAYNPSIRCKKGTETCIRRLDRFARANRRRNTFPASAQPPEEIFRCVETQTMDCLVTSPSVTLISFECRFDLSTRSASCQIQHEIKQMVSTDTGNLQKELKEIEVQTLRSEAVDVSCGPSDRVSSFYGWETVQHREELLQDLTAVNFQVFSLLQQMLPQTCRDAREITWSNRFFFDEAETEPVIRGSRSNF